MIQRSKSLAQVLARRVGLGEVSVSARGSILGSMAGSECGMLVDEAEIVQSDKGGYSMHSAEDFGGSGHYRF